MALDLDSATDRLPCLPVHISKTVHAICAVLGKAIPLCCYLTLIIANSLFALAVIYGIFSSWLDEAWSRECVGNLKALSSLANL